VRNEFVEALKTHQTTFGLSLDDLTAERLADYYELVLEHNPLLHLVAPCSAEEFAVRHILESLTLLEHLPIGAKFADVGTGAGLPSIPCLLGREDLSAVLIESKEKKAKYLRDAVSTFGLEWRAKIVARQFSEFDPSGCDIVTVRALDKMTERLPRLIVWSRGRSLILFAGPAVRELLNRMSVRFDETLIPMSERRFIFFVRE
jgi:16S rRNA (guanine527-N7)-methyltransferase